MKLVPPLIGNAYMWEGTSSRVGKNDYVPLGTYQNINLENFGGGPVKYFTKVPYSNFLGRTSQKKHPVVACIINFSVGTVRGLVGLCMARRSNQRKPPEGPLVGMVWKLRSCWRLIVSLPGIVLNT